MRLFFGDCVLDLERRELLRGGELVHLTPKAFELLQTLLARRPRVLTKVELRDVLWPDTHVQDANLPNLVAEVRSALADEARSPLYLRTVHGIGYAFCGEATELGPLSEAETPRPFVYRLVWAGGLVALAEGEYVLGRHPDSVIPIDTKGVSRRHARLHIADGRAILEDLGSRNGTYVNDEALTAPAVLEDGREFRLGSLVFTFRVSLTQAISDTRDS